MVDFDTLKGIDGYRAAFPTVFEDLDDADATRVIKSVHSGVLDGWEPSASDVQEMADAILGPGPTKMSRAELQARAAELSGNTPEERGRQARRREIKRRGAIRALDTLQCTMRERGYTIYDPVDTDELAAWAETDEAAEAIRRADDCDLDGGNAAVADEIIRRETRDRGGE